MVIVTGFTAEPDRRNSCAFRGATTRSRGPPEGLSTPAFGAVIVISASTDYYHGLLVTNEELAIRSSIGLYIFTAPGVNEELLEEAGFHVEISRDTTHEAAIIAERWRDARQAHTARLVEIESKANYEGLQRFLSCTCKLSSENRLRRYVYRASKKM